MRSSHPQPSYADPPSADPRRWLLLFFTVFKTTLPHLQFRHVQQACPEATYLVHRGDSPHEAPSVLYDHPDLLRKYRERPITWPAGDELLLLFDPSCHPDSNFAVAHLKSVGKWAEPYEGLLAARYSQPDAPAPRIVNYLRFVSYATNRLAELCNCMRTVHMSPRTYLGGMSPQDRVCFSEAMFSLYQLLDSMFVVAHACLKTLESSATNDVSILKWWLDHRPDPSNVPHESNLDMTPMFRLMQKHRAFFGSRLDPEPPTKPSKPLVDDDNADDDAMTDSDAEEEDVSVSATDLLTKSTETARAILHSGSWNEARCVSQECYARSVDPTHEYATNDSASPTGSLNSNHAGGSGGGHRVHLGESSNVFIIRRNEQTMLSSSSPSTSFGYGRAYSDCQWSTLDPVCRLLLYAWPQQHRQADDVNSSLANKRQDAVFSTIERVPLNKHSRLLKYIHFAYSATRDKQIRANDAGLVPSIKAWMDMETPHVYPSLNGEHELDDPTLPEVWLDTKVRGMEQSRSHRTAPIKDDTVITCQVGRDALRCAIEWWLTSVVGAYRHRARVHIESDADFKCVDARLLPCPVLSLRREASLAWEGRFRTTTQSLYRRHFRQAGGLLALATQEYLGYALANDTTFQAWAGIHCPSALQFQDAARLFCSSVLSGASFWAAQHIGVSASTTGAHLSSVFESKAADNHCALLSKCANGMRQPTRMADTLQSWVEFVLDSSLLSVPLGQDRPAAPAFGAPMKYPADRALVVVTSDNDKSAITLRTVSQPSVTTAAAIHKSKYKLRKRDHIQRLSTRDIIEVASVLLKQEAHLREMQARPSLVAITAEEHTLANLFGPHAPGPIAFAALSRSLIAFFKACCGSSDGLRLVLDACFVLSINTRRKQDVADMWRLLTTLRRSHSFDFVLLQCYLYARSNIKQVAGMSNYSVGIADREAKSTSTCDFYACPCCETVQSIYVQSRGFKRARQEWCCSHNVAGTRYSVVDMKTGTLFCSNRVEKWRPLSPHNNTKCGDEPLLKLPVINDRRVTFRGCSFGVCSQPTEIKEKVHEKNRVKSKHVPRASQCCNIMEFDDSFDIYNEHGVMCCSCREMEFIKGERKAIKTMHADVFSFSKSFDELKGHRGRPPKDSHDAARNGMFSRTMAYRPIDVYWPELYVVWTDGFDAKTRSDIPDPRWKAPKEFFEAKDKTLYKSAAYDFLKALRTDKSFRSYFSRRSPLLLFYTSS